MAERPLPTPEQLRQLLSYDPVSGKLYWKERGPELFKSKNPKRQAAGHQRWNARFSGQEAMIGIDAHGYYQGTIFGHYLKAHRVIYALVKGHWPSGEIDHVNGNRRDNRARNLREVSHKENLRNCHKSVRNKSGVTGVSWNKVHQKWQASITINGKLKALGAFKNKGDAIQARRDAEAKAGFGPTHGSDRKSENCFIPKSNRV